MVLVMIAMFLLGFMSGAISLLSYVLFLTRKSMKTKIDSIKELAKAAEESIGGDTKVLDRLVKVRDIQQRQTDLLSQVDRPQKNSLDGKYKNLLNGEIKQLEEEKTAILNSILADGFDPLIAVTGFGGEAETMKLSEFMAKSGMGAPAPSKPEPKKRLLTVVPSDDDGDDGQGETTH